MENPQTPQPSAPPPGSTVLQAAGDLSLAGHILDHTVSTLREMLPEGHSFNDEAITETARHVLQIACGALGPPPRKPSVVDSIFGSNLGNNLGPMLITLGQMLMAQQQPPPDMPPSDAPPPTEGDGEPSPPKDDPPN